MSTVVAAEAAVIQTHVARGGERDLATYRRTVSHFIRHAGRAMCTIQLDFFDQRTDALGARKVPSHRIRHRSAESTERITLASALATRFTEVSLAGVGVPSVISFQHQMLARLVRVVTVLRVLVVLRQEARAPLWMARFQGRARVPLALVVVHCAAARRTS